MYVYRQQVPVKDLGGGILMQCLDFGTNLNVLHWNMSDGAVVVLHQHPEEQFGYVIAGGFRMKIGAEETVLRQGDCYYIPPNVPHTFIAIGDTEAIDVFSPVRRNIPGAGK